MPFEGRIVRECWRIQKDPNLELFDSDKADNSREAKLSFKPNGKFTEGQFNGDSPLLHLKSKSRPSMGILSVHLSPLTGLATSL